MHSKVYYAEHQDETASAIIGSHNTTGFALAGLNGEAAVLIEGPKKEVQFQEIRRHLSGQGE
jgi:HKD family nuclease